MARLLVLVAVGFLVLWLLHWFRTTPPERVRKVLTRWLLYGGVGLLILAAATGRLSPIFAAIGAAIPLVLRLVQLLQLVPLIQRALRALGIGTGRSDTDGTSGTSSIRTERLEMTLDHASGAMDGRVLAGPYAGRRLGELARDDLLDLLAQCRATDPKSAQLLEAYLDRMHGDDWRAQDADAGQGHAAGGSDPRLTRQEALAILGLAEDADAAAIRAAHRRLMQRFHPDRGGSDYLAAKINEAKRVLLDDRA